MTLPRTSYRIIILLYSLIPIVTPGFSALDANGSKFLVIALLNLFTCLFLISQKDTRELKSFQEEFFTRTFGFVFLLFLLISLLSFIKAINIPEAIIQFSKTFTVFSSVFILFLIFRTDSRYFRQFMIIMAIVLLFDCLTVFSGITFYILGRIRGISDIMSVYSNKNILASAIFVKIPVAMWLHIYGQGRWKRAGLVLLLFAFMATLFMSSRAFYIGLIFLTCFFVLYSSISYNRSGNRVHIRNLVGFGSVLLIAIIVFTFSQQVLYPRIHDRYNSTIIERLGSISGEEGSIRLRLETWSNTVQLIRENPLAGVGTGNWKIAELKMENQVATGFSYMYKAHNDFLEFTAETGLPGGLVYSALFIIPFVLFIRRWKGKTFEVNEYLLLPVLGLFCYCFDAFFNFPADRPEIQVIFSAYLAGVMAFYPFQVVKKMSFPELRIPLITLFILLMGSVAFILLSNFYSARYQEISRQDLEGKKYSHSAAYMISRFPLIPNLDVAGAPISVIKAGYLLHERKYAQVIGLLKNDRSSPYDSRPEYFMALAYEKLGDTTNELDCLVKSIELKPFYYNSVRKICRIYDDRKDYSSALSCLNHYLSRQKDNKDAWFYCSVLWEKSGKPGKSQNAVDSALVYIPADTVLMNRRTGVLQRIRLMPYQAIVDSGLSYSRNKEYAEAIRCFTELLNRDSSLSLLYEYRGECYYFTRDFSKCIADLNMAIKAKPFEGSLYNYRGASLHFLGRDSEACRDFERGKKLNDPNAAGNYSKLCVPGTQKTKIPNNH
jgi:putative inorganic carbon (hco3(-)) transporter